eukprot:2412157-Amphidinium_carterae.1
MNSDNCIDSTHKDERNCGNSRKNGYFQFLVCVSPSPCWRKAWTGSPSTATLPDRWPANAELS